MTKLQLWMQQLVSHPLVKNHLGLFTGYFALIFLFKLFSYGPNHLLEWRYLFTLLGSFLGLYIGVLDRLVYAYVSQPQDPLSVQIKTLVNQKRYWEVIKVAHNDSQTFRRLSTNNVLFLGVWVFLSLFVLTTSINYFAKGLMMGMGLILARDLIRDLVNIEMLSQRLFWPIARPVKPSETKIVVYLFLGAFAFLTLLFI